MTWQKILYGSLVAGGLTTTGTLFWWRTAKTSFYVVDQIEIYQASLERPMATRTGDGSGSAITTVRVASVSYGATDPESRFWFPSGSASSNLYVAADGGSTNSFIFTNTFHGTYFADPFELEYVVWTNTGDRYITGPYDQITVDGHVAGSFGDFDGTYVLKELTRGIAGVPYGVFPGIVGIPHTKRAVYASYTNDADDDKVLIDMSGHISNPVHVHITNLNPVVTPNKILDEDWGALLLYLTGAQKQENVVAFLRAGQNLVAQPPIPDAGYGPWDQPWLLSAATTFIGWSTGITTTAGTLTDSTSQFRDSYVVVPTVVRNIITGTPFYRDYVAMTDALRESADGGGESSSSAGAYLDDSKSTAGEFQGFADQLPETLLTNVLKDAGVVDGQWEIEQWTYEDTNTYLITSQNWTEVYAAAHELKWTHADTPDWTTNSSSANAYLWDSGWQPSLPGAKTQCSLDTPATTNESLSPEVVATIYVRESASSVTNYRAICFARRSILVSSGLTTNITKDVDFYMQVATNVTGEATTAISWPFNGAGGPSETNLDMYATTALNAEELDRFDSAVSGGNSRSVTSAVQGQISFPPGTWPSDPAPFLSGSLPRFAETTRGFKVDDQDAVMKWDFQYAETALP